MIADINAAKAAPGSNTITLVAGTTFTLTAVDNTTDGATGLPVITKGNLTIVGNADTIERSTAQGTPAFRLLDVAAGGSLTLNNLTLQGGLAGAGGGIHNQGTLTLGSVTVQNNVANGDYGGGIWSSGTLTAEGCVIRSNQALGADYAYGGGTIGDPAYGGGLYAAGGTVTLRNT